MFENRSAPLLPRRAYYARLGRGLAVAGALVVVYLGVGMAGYHGFENLSWLDSFLNASMILSGMGPVNPVVTTGGKLFAGCYAIFSGLVLISIVGFTLGPAAHRLLHSFHADEKEKKPAAPKK